MKKLEQVKKEYKDILFPCGGDDMDFEWEEFSKIVNKEIKIPFSEEELHDLLNGETFDWTFDGVDVHLYMGYDDNDGQNCIKCGNPKIMYWCNECEANHEEENCCPACGGKCDIDKKYHNDCN